MAKFEPPIAWDDHLTFVHMVNGQMKELADKCVAYRKALEDIIQTESETSSATAMRVIAQQAIGIEPEEFAEKEAEDG